MSKGPGKVERAIRQDIAERRRHLDRVVFTTSDLCQAAFGEDADAEYEAAVDAGADTEYADGWTKSRRVSALRAMHRIMATEPGWTTERLPAGRSEPLLFIWQWRQSGPDGTAPRPQAVHELILATSFRGRELVWDQAVITSRGGGGRSSRVTIEHTGQSYRGKELPDGRIVVRGLGVGMFCHERARAKVEEAHDRRLRVQDAIDQRLRP